MKTNPLILAVETSGRTGSVAIALGEKMLDEISFSAPMKHSAEIFPAIQELLKRSGRKPKEIEHIYISVGPGSFTGLRISVALAKAMHLANSAKIVAVDTLDVLAANVTTYIKGLSSTAQAKEEVNANETTKIAAVLDAKRGQFFIAAYEYQQQQWKKIMPDCLMSAEQFLEKFAGKSRPVWLLGEGLVYYKDRFKADGVHFLDEKYWNPRAENVYKLGRQMALAGRFANPLTLQPTYLRKPDIKIKK